MSSVKCKSLFGLIKLFFVVDIWPVDQVIQQSGSGMSALKHLSTPVKVISDLFFCFFKTLFK